MNPFEDRVLIIAPTGRDADLISQLLGAAGLTRHVCASVPQALGELEVGAAALVIADEALDDVAVPALARFRQFQPPWSDIPMIVLTRKGDIVGGGQPRLWQLGQVTIIERPVGRRPLLTAVQAAIRARMRQYEARAQMLELERIGDDLRAANAKKDELLGLVSHELRTPLTGILGCSDVLLRRKDELDPGTAETLLRDINDHGKRLQRVIENMLVLSRAETALETATEPLLLQRMLPPIFHGLTPLAGERQLQVKIAPDLPPVVANPLFVELVVTNLVRNSEKYAAEGTDIQVELGPRDEMVTIEVADRGAELEQAQVDHMFEAFYRDPDRSRFVGGLGLGLPVCKRLTEIQGGSIHARPRKGGGLHVTVALPTATL